MARLIALLFSSRSTKSSKRTSSRRSLPPRSNLSHSHNHRNTLMKSVLWIVQVLLALVFVASGSMKLFAFDQFAASAPVLADQHGLVTFIGIAELAGAIGLIFPRLPRNFPVLTAWDAVRLPAIMVLATGLHLMHREF